ncbi:E3 SUMO-protein ligase NSE2-like [Clytia hemisphaerica]|uniref:E3 SUMO-protein ligase NSE2 n=1 Tax=Clytia hemisphaerica TaxID=252671 RepID=A0A7M5WQN9_9CNID
MAFFRYLDDSTEKFTKLDRVIKSGFKLTTEAADDLEKGDENVRELRDLMIQYASMEHDMKNYLKAAAEAKLVFEDSMNGDPDGENEVDFEVIFADKLQTVSTKNSKDDFSKHKSVKAFDETVMEHHFGGSQNESESGEHGSVANGDNDDDDDEIEMTQDDSQRFICPLTKIEMVDPVKNICGHNYSRVAIETHIKNNKNRVQGIRCPVAGCAHMVSRDTLEDNAVLAYKIKQKNRN